MKLDRIVVTAFAFALLAGARNARAAEGGGDDTAAPGAPIHDSERHSWTAALYGGMGDLHTFPKKGDEQLASGNGISFDVGKSVSQRLLVLASAQLVHSGPSTNGIYGVGAQAFLTQRLYVRGGIGAANYKTKITDPSGSGLSLNIDRWSPGAFAGLGVEWLQFRTLALDSQLSWMGADYPNKKQGDFSALNVALTVGVRWYGP